MTEHLSNFKQYTADEIITLQAEERKKVLIQIYMTIAIITLLMIMLTFLIVKYTYIDERMIYWFYLTTKNGCIEFR